MSASPAQRVSFGLPTPLSELVGRAKNTRGLPHRDYHFGFPCNQRQVPLLYSVTVRMTEPFHIFPRRTRPFFASNLRRDLPLEYCISRPPENS